ncbi:hypothetical protein H6F98_24155 [Microcoleus sp. FACHB-SPT15]|nr:hypothetical protein [Microcoleus sp. FACHB-SPT15]MBD1808524.1 hypothetical protein [Microcoleus sp. FACHB-SPT15]
MNYLIVATKREVGKQVLWSSAFLYRHSEQKERAVFTWGLSRAKAAKIQK